MQGWYYLRMAEAENDFFLQARKFKDGEGAKKEKRKKEKWPMRGRYFISW
jgi:hypothetical protein